MICEKRIFLSKRPGWALPILTSFFFASAAYGAEGEKKPRGGFTLEDRKDFYQQLKLDHGTALGRSALLPGLGNFYAQQEFVGALFMGTFGMGLFTLLYGLTRQESVLNEWTYLGAGFVLGSYGGAMLTSHQQVTAYNDDLKRRYFLNDADVQDQTFAPRFGLSVHWAF